MFVNFSGYKERSQSIRRIHFLTGTFWELWIIFRVPASQQNVIIAAALIYGFFLFPP